MNKEIRKLKILFTKPGGNASKGSVSTRITLPVKWIKELGITPDNREVKTSFDGKKITIEPHKDDE
ncbi:AbrB/MazE/SpoVT family DNA-binding domain-containing protein [Paraclostridium tenue]|uniref:AbrB/MazE/SpoVT family DNA-binding domain-containing protein n=1 Tax=Paraclostridium tenue TaxID=1737 RepID=A0ABP3XLB7_9FIRM